MERQTVNSLAKISAEMICACAIINKAVENIHGKIDEDIKADTSSLLFLGNNPQDYIMFVVVVEKAEKEKRRCWRKHCDDGGLCI